MLSARPKRHLFELADIAASARRDENAAAISPIALDTVKRIDAVRYRARHQWPKCRRTVAGAKEQSAPLLAALELGLGEQRARLSKRILGRKPIDYMLRRWDRFARFIEGGPACLTNNAAERALRGFALGRKSWLFAGSERGANHAAVMATLIVTALCRARHRAVYAARRTMPSRVVFPRFLADRRLVGSA